jgi:CrcB protein
MTALLLVATGGALGASVRYLLVSYVAGRFPWSILLANVSGSFILGTLLAAASPGTLLFIGVGFCGALTTFSTFALDTLILARDGRRMASLSNIVLSVAGSILALVAGLALARAAGL